MSIFFSADQHLGHHNVLGHDGRPFANIDVHDEVLIANWNSVVTPKDTVYICGDFAWRNHPHYIGALKGKKVLITGTHDRMPDSSKRLFTQVIGGRNQPGILEANINGTWFVLSHYPLASWCGSPRGSLHCHGHCHGRMQEIDTRRRCDISVVVWDWTPVPVEVVIAKLSARDHTACQRRTPEELARDVLALTEENRKWRSMQHERR